MGNGRVKSQALELWWMPTTSQLPVVVFSREVAHTASGTRVWGERSATLSGNASVG